MNIGHPNAPQRPKREGESLPTIQFQLRAVSFREGTFPSCHKKVTDPMIRNAGTRPSGEVGYSGWDGDVGTLRIVENKPRMFRASSKTAKSNPHFISFVAVLLDTFNQAFSLPWISENGTLILISLKNFPNFKFPCKQVLIVLCRRRHRVWLLLEQLVGFWWGGSTLLGPD